MDCLSMSRPLVRLACLGILLLAGQSLAGEVPYTWIDEKGNFHMVDSITAVPPVQRKAAQMRVDQGVLAGEEQGSTYNKMGNGVDTPATGSAGVAGGTAGAPTAAGAAEATVRPSTAAAPPAGPPTSKAAAPPAAPVQDQAYWQNQLDGARAQKAALELELQGIEAEMLRLRIQTPPGFHQQVANLETRRMAIPEQLSALEKRISEDIPAAARRAGASPSRLR